MKRGIAMLRIVFCDVDGTLLPSGTSTPAPETLEALRRLTDRGITVVIASGRPYSQLRALFGALSHRLLFICLDGALTRRHDFILHKRPLPKKVAQALLKRFPNAVVHGRETTYALGETPVTGGRFVSTPNEIGEDYLKLELYASSAPEPSPYYRVAYRTDGLTELVAPCADKGNAAATLLQKLGISPDQAVAFGDGENDVSLLSTVGHPYRMRGTLPELSAPETDSVIDTLHELFQI